MAAGLTQRLTSSVVLMSILFVVLVFSLYVLSNTAENLDRFGQYYFWLVLADGAVLVFMAVLIASNSFHLLREFRRRVAGSRLTVKLIVMSVFLSLVPVSLVYMFSVKFLKTDIDSFFDVKIDEVINDALELSRDSLALQTRVMRRVTNDVAFQLSKLTTEEAAAALESTAVRVEAAELRLLDGNSTLIASAHPGDPILQVQDTLSQEIVSAARDGIDYVGVDPLGNGDLIIRIIVPIMSIDAKYGNNVLQALFPVDKKSGELAVKVQQSYQRYQQLEFLSKPLKLGSILTLSLTLMLSVLTALWFAFYAARRMMAPVHDLVEGTKQVADGDYSIRLYKHGDDELRYLVESFNEMAGHLEESDRQARSSRENLENQRAYLETVLRHISTGVITLDEGNILRTANDAAGAILDENIHASIGQSLGSPGEKRDQLHQVYLLNKQQIESGQDWTQEVEIFQQHGRRVLLCRGAQLEDSQGKASGVVIVFDDITSIIQAQRNAAWSEVARRLAHEIKNPLTPIQLSAERLRRKYLDKMQGDDAEMLDRLTHTIVQQVGAMKSMVKAFADYANTPAAQFVRTDINALVLEVVDLYRDVDEVVAISVQLGTNLPAIPADVTRMRQLLHNLIKNALEAQRDSEGAEIEVSTCVTQTDGNHVLELSVCDNGPGLPVDLIDKLFEPYVTSKPKGTGLGLAIVKKIVEEHSGVIYARNRDNRGACMIMHFPIPSAVSQLEEVKQ